MGWLVAKKKMISTILKREKFILSENTKLLKLKIKIHEILSFKVIGKCNLR
jgi:hypothetical protein